LLPYREQIDRCLPLRALGCNILAVVQQYDITKDSPVRR
jgi:hypothetical protein